MTIIDKLLDNAFQDTELLKKNDSMGDVFSVPRTVDFCLIALEEEKAKTVTSFINENQYGRAEYKQIDDQYRIMVYIDFAPTQNVVCSISALMVCISHLFGVEYDGWGCSLKTNT